MGGLPPVKADVDTLPCFHSSSVGALLRRFLLGSNGGCCHLKSGLGGPALSHAVTLTGGLRG